MSDTGSFSVAEAATLTGFARQTIYRAVRDGRLNRWLIRDDKGQARLSPDGVTAIRCGVIRSRVDSKPRPEPAPAPTPAPEPEPPADEPDPAFWSEWGRIAEPDELINFDQEEEHVAQMVWHLCEPLEFKAPDPDRFRYWLWHLENTAAECRADVAAGARFDQAKWDKANAEGLLEDMDCDAAGEMLRSLREAGRIPAELLTAVSEALGDE